MLACLRGPAPANLFEMGLAASKTSESLGGFA